MSQESLEADILAWVAKNSSDESIRCQCKTVTIESRDYTGAGYYTALGNDHSVSPSTARTSDATPAIESEELLYGGGSVLFLTDGWLTTLEIYGNGNVEFPKDIVGYKLVPYDT